jgi:hypothetical protein
MTDDTLSNRPGLTALQRAASGRLGMGASWDDPRTWRDMILRGEAPALVLIAVFIGVALSEIFTGGPRTWGLSARSLAEGRWSTIGSHMIAHASLPHLMMNSGALLALTPVASAGSVAGFPDGCATASYSAFRVWPGRRPIWPCIRPV